MVKLHEYEPHKATAAMLSASCGHDTITVEVMMQPHVTPDALSAQEIPTKTCPRCGEEKPATTEYFHRRKLGRYGLCTECKVCGCLRAQKWREANPEQLQETRRVYEEANTEKIRERNNAYNAANREKRRAYGQKWREANRERFNKQVREWSKANPNKTRIQGQKRRARKRNAEGSHTVADIQAQYKSQKGKCYYCGCKVGNTYDVDHVIPLSRGGSNGPENLVIACPLCNRAKHDKLPHEWAEGGRLL